MMEMSKAEKTKRIMVSPLEIFVIMLTK